MILKTLVVHTDEVSLLYSCLDNFFLSLCWFLQRIVPSIISLCIPLLCGVIWSFGWGGNGIPWFRKYYVHLISHPDWANTFSCNSVSIFSCLIFYLIQKDSDIPYHALKGDVYANRCNKWVLQWAIFWLGIVWLIYALPYSIYCYIGRRAVHAYSCHVIGERKKDILTSVKRPNWPIRPNKRLHLKI